MDDVLLSAHAVIAANCPRVGIPAVGGACHFSDNCNGINAFHAQNHDRRGLHGTYQRWKKRLVDKVRVVFFQQLVGKTHHFHSGDNQSFPFESGYDFSHYSTNNGAWFQND